MLFHFIRPTSKFSNDFWWNIARLLLWEEHIKIWGWSYSASLDSLYL